MKNRREESGGNRRDLTEKITEYFVFLPSCGIACGRGCVHCRKVGKWISTFLRSIVAYREKPPCDRTRPRPSEESFSYRTVAAQRENFLAFGLPSAPGVVAYHFLFRLVVAYRETFFVHRPAGKSFFIPYGYRSSRKTLFRPS